MHSLLQDVFDKASAKWHILTYYIPASLLPRGEQGHTGDQLQQYGPHETRGVERKRRHDKDEEQAPMHSENLGLSSTSDRPAECSQQERRTVKRKRGCEKDEEQELIHQ
ncbi:hypothetical protein AAFF_G00161730, partial [Aldrovandia affinis]